MEWNRIGWGWGLPKRVNPCFQSQHWKCDFIHIYGRTSLPLILVFYLCLASRYYCIFINGLQHYVVHWWFICFCFLNLFLEWDKSTYLWKQFEVLVIIYNELLVVVLTLTAFFSMAMAYLIICMETEAKKTLKFIVKNSCFGFGSLAIS